MNHLTLTQSALFPSRYPPYLIFFVTSRCNMKCKHCFYWQELSSDRNELSLDEIERISKSLPELFFLRITGGEPFLRTDLYQIIKLFYENSAIRRIGISTNGFEVNKIIEITDQIVGGLKNLSFELGISIDDLYEKHDKIRACRGAFNNAMKTYEGLAKIREKNKNFNLGFLITMMKDNQDYLEEIFEYLKGKQPDTIGLNMIRGTPKCIDEMITDVAKYKHFADLLNRYNMRTVRPFIEKMRFTKSEKSQDIIIKTLQNNRIQIPCLAGEKIAVLYPNGNVSACELLDSTIGNIRDYNCNFQQLWKAKRRKEITVRIKKEKCFCTHECFITASLIFRIKALLQMFLTVCLRLILRRD